MRKRTGLANRYRHGRSTYSRRKKNGVADTYGAWDNGRQTRSERVNGSVLTYDHRKQEWR